MESTWKQHPCVTVRGGPGETEAQMPLAGGAEQGPSRAPGGGEEEQGGGFGEEGRRLAATSGVRNKKSGLCNFSLNARKLLGPLLTDP